MVDVRTVTYAGEEWVSRDDLVRFLHDAATRAHLQADGRKRPKGPAHEGYTVGIRDALHSTAHQLKAMGA